MSDQYLGEIRMVGFNFAPVGWALCSGQILNISQNTALFSILGTTYGGDGKSNFALPNFQAMAPMGYGNGAGLSPRMFGETGGQYTVPLLTGQIAAHNHGVACINGAGSLNSPSNAVWSNAKGDRVSPSLYAAAATGVNMNNTVLQITGSNQAHNNLPPYLSIFFVIAMQGIYPSRN